MGRATGLGLLLVVVAMLLSGCAMCCSPYDEAYGFTGGRWPRADLCHGRVGSAFDAGGGVTVLPLDGMPAEAMPAPGVPADPQPPMKSVQKQSADWSGDLMPE